jgi:hypothetical protein
VAVPPRRRSRACAVLRRAPGATSLLDGADNDETYANDPTLIADYRADLAALGSHTAPVGSAFWIAPTETDTGAEDQGLVAVSTSAPPAPPATSTSIPIEAEKIGGGPNKLIEALSATLSGTGDESATFTLNAPYRSLMSDASPLTRTAAPAARRPIRPARPSQGRLLPG